MIIKNVKILVLFLFITITFSCSSNDEEVPPRPIDYSNDQEEEEEEEIVYADIDFSNWKVTLPVDANNNGSPDEYQPSQLINYGYQSLSEVQPYMYDDIIDSSLVFYAYPESSTANSSFSRTELRELINTSNSGENWTLLQGGELTGRLKVQSVSENNNSSDDYHKVIVMQIHGIISEEDMATHGFSSNNGPPLIKIYWKDGFVWCHKKSLIDESTDGIDLLETSNNTWTDIKVNLGYVGYDIFDFRITASNAQIEVQLNNDTPYIYQDISLNKWPYENYFKAGNYLTSADEDAFSYVKYFNLVVTH